MQRNNKIILPLMLAKHARHFCAKYKKHVFGIRSKRNKVWNAVHHRVAKTGRITEPRPRVHCAT